MKHPIAAGGLLPASLEPLADTVASFIQESTSESTRRAYASDLRVFRGWCEFHGMSALPAEPLTLALFLADQAQGGVAPATLSRRTAAVRYAHEAQGLPSPASHKVVSATLKGIRRVYGMAPRQKAPATADRVLTMIQHCSPTLQGLRDRAILSLGFAGAFRRSELAALTVEDLEDVPAGYRIHIRSSKTDQEGEGQVVAVPHGSRLRPVAAAKEWLAEARITCGPVFRPFIKGGGLRDSALTDRSIANIIKEYANRAGLPAADFGGHSLRSGFLTSAAASKQVSIFKMMEVSRHKRVDTVRVYVRLAELFQDHAGEEFL